MKCTSLDMRAKLTAHTNICQYVSYTSFVWVLLQCSADQEPGLLTQRAVDHTAINSVTLGQGVGFHICNWCITPPMVTHACMHC